MIPNFELSAQIDALLSSFYPSDKPGAAVLVAKDGKVIFRKGYGMANLELGVPVEPLMVFRIASITKQFTAVCILMLFEQGKLDLLDDITRFLPDFLTGGRKVTIENLLTHTAGIHDYTNRPDWQIICSKDSTLAEIIDIFKDEPLEFEPGEQFRYSNSGYILLGAIIEKISGIQFSTFLQENIFEPLGMSHSLCETADRIIIPGRVAGYVNKGDKCLNAAFLSMTHAYAAGGIASNVDDLALWDAALFTGKLVKPQTLAQAFKPFVLKNGDSIQYGYGWSIYEHSGISFIEHTGGINGFTTCGLRVPAEGVYVVALTNCENPETYPLTIVEKLTELIIGKPFEKPTAIDVAENILDDYIGIYKISEKEERAITRQGTQLYSQRSASDSPMFEIFPCADDAFFLKNIYDRFFFERNKEGKVTGMKVTRRYGPPERCPLIDKSLPI